ncbi:type IV toxin-antitoxin system AbiEi family antitoxin domain-containing protein [Arthrobacter alpinus]|nr:type IV toxin-antitoxin system AbiEi family antitoxin domain-containing protein [Arthrobacter alpinus]
MDTSPTEARFTQLWPKGRIIATTEQLLSSGLTTRNLEVAVNAGLVRRMRRGVYIPMHQWQGRKPWIQDKLVLSGHIVQSKGQHVYSHFSAARLHHLHVWNSSPLIHISSSYNSSPSKIAPDVVMHTQNVPDEAVVERVIQGLGLVRFTTLERTVLDCATVAPFAQAVVIGDSALAAGLSLHDLDQLLVGAMGRRGIRRARRAISSLSAASESAGETRTRLIVGELPIEQPEQQVWISTNNGRFRVDFLWRGLRLILEFDGDTKYFDYGETSEQALIKERERENALIEEGWRFIRVKWKHLEDPEMLKVRIMRAYLAAAQAAA